MTGELTHLRVVAQICQVEDPDGSIGRASGQVVAVRVEADTLGKEMEELNRRLVVIQRQMDTCNSPRRPSSARSRLEPSWASLWSTLELSCRSRKRRNSVRKA